MIESNNILEQLAVLHRAYPEESVDIWVSWRMDTKTIGYSANVGEGYDQVFAGGWAPSPEESVKRLLEKAGDRSKASRIAKRRAELEKELAELNAKEVA